MAFNVGDKVVCYRKGGKHTCWVDHMDDLVRDKEVGKVIDLGDNSKAVVAVKFKGSYPWYVPTSCLKRVK